MIADIKKSAEQKMQKSVEALKHDLGKVRTGPRAHGPARSHPRRLLRHADADRPVREPDARRCADDRRAAVGEERWFPVIEKAIRDSDLGIESGDLR
jgi:ribosome recycling factor